MFHDRMRRRGFEVALSYLGMMDNKASEALDSSSTSDYKAYEDKHSFYSIDHDTSFFGNAVWKVNLNCCQSHSILDQI